MHSLYILFLSILSFIFLSGFLFEERGGNEKALSLPPEHIPTKTDTKESSDNFPLLKIKAYKRISNDAKPKETTPTKAPLVQKPIEEQGQTQEPITLPEPKKEPIIKPRKVKKKASRLGTKTNKIPHIIKQTKPTKRKEKYSRQKRRQTGHVRKLIFDKKTSFSDIPLPLPSLASLKLESLMKSIPLIPLSDIPIIDSLLPSPSKTSRNRIRNRNMHYSRPQGKHTNQTNLDMANIRIGKSEDYTSIVFDSFRWEGYNTESTVEASESGSYHFSYEPQKNRIVGTLQGYSAFSALLGDQSELFKGNELIKNIYIDRYLGNDGIQFVIQLKKKVQMTVLDMKNPARIIVNLYPQ